MRRFTKISLLLLTALLLAMPLLAQQDVISTKIGGGPDNMPALDANVNQPSEVAVDTSGNFYITAYAQNRVFKVSSTGTLTVFAGTGLAGYAGDGVVGGAKSALLNGPNGVVVDSAGNVYISDYNNFVIRKVSTANTITTIAGEAGQCNYNGDGSPATTKNLCHPIGLAIDTSNVLYIADAGNCRIRKLNGTTISTVAGDGTCGYSGDNGSAINAELNQPGGIAVDSSFNLYIYDTFNYAIRKVTKSNAKITTIAGTPQTSGFSGDGGLATAAKIAQGENLIVDSTGATVTIADQYNLRIRQFTVGGNITTIAGSGTGGFCGDAGLATLACIYYPQGIAVDSSNNYYIADLDNERIRKFTIGHNISTVAGNGSTTEATIVNGIPPTGVVLQYPFAVTADTAGNFYVEDTNNYVSRELVKSTNVVNTFAGTGVGGYSGDGGLATAAQISLSYGVVKDSLGNVYIADSGNHIIRKVDTTGKITTFAGIPDRCGYTGDGGAATSAELCNPDGLAIDSANNLYIADQSNYVVREVVGGTINTIAGTNRAGYAGDGGPATSAQLWNPEGVAVDKAGNVFIADTANCRVRRIDAVTKIITTFAGNGACTFSGDGIATENGLNSPAGVQVDANGNVFIADTNNERLRWVDTSGNMTTFAGAGSFAYNGDGTLATLADLAAPSAIYVDSSGNYTVADQYNWRIRGITAFSALNKTTSNLIFGLQSVGTTSSPQPVTISALGPLTINSITTTGDFSEADNCPSSLANGATCTMNVYFAPTASGTRTGTITINDNGFFSTVQTINLRGAASAILVSPLTISFGNQLVKTTSAAQNETVTNNGSTSVTMGTISLTQTTDFSISSNTCPASGSPLAAHASCTIGLKFSPKSTGAKKSTLSIGDSDPTSPQLVALSGTGTSNVLLTPSTVTFTPAQAIGTASKATAITLTNNTGASITLGNPAVTMSGDFTNAAGTTCTNSLVVASGGTCIVNVAFKPTAVGPRTGSMSVADSDTTSPQTAALSGIGTAVKFSPTTVNFGTVNVGTQVSSTVTITNVGTTTITFTAATLSGANSADFSFNSGNPPCSGSLAPAAICTFSVFFDPSAKGTRKANYNVFDNSFGSPQQLSLTGTGQ
jgi:trimeric autotransporter adhesin